LIHFFSLACDCYFTQANLICSSERSRFFDQESKVFSTAMLSQPTFPWNDRLGRFSALRLIAFLIVIAPLMWLGQLTLTGNLGSKPLTRAIHFTGDWAIHLLLLSLFVTPLRIITHWPQLVGVRRMLGVSVLCYVLLHLLLYTAEQAFNLPKVVNEIIMRFYLTIGFAALLGLLALGLTSTDSMVRRLGPAWNKLHKLVYGIAALGLLHYFLQSKIDVSQAVLMTGFFLWLMGFRLMQAKGYGSGLKQLALLAICAAVLTALIEASWYGLMTGIGARRVLEANLDFSFTIRSSWWVLLAGLLMLIPALARQSAAPIRQRIRA
jgi:methionine sulfoxide reductase heme-binding subunit